MSRGLNGVGDNAKEKVRRPFWSNVKPEMAAQTKDFQDEDETALNDDVKNWKRHSVAEENVERILQCDVLPSQQFHSFKYADIYVTPPKEETPYDA